MGSRLRLDEADLAKRNLPCEIYWNLPPTPSMILCWVLLGLVLIVGIGGIIDAMQDHDKK